MSLSVSVVPAFSAARFGDLSSGHYPWPPRKNNQGSPDVFVNNLPWHRLGDHWLIHCAPGCHDGYLVHGAPGVFINNKEAGRIGDLISCSPHDAFVAQGSPDTFCGNFIAGGVEVPRPDYASMDEMEISWENTARQIHQI